MGCSGCKSYFCLRRRSDVSVVVVLNKGQVLTDYYRLMNRHGGYVWLQTCATIICNAKNVDEQNIIAINYVLRSASPASTSQRPSRPY